MEIWSAEDVLQPLAHLCPLYTIGLCSALQPASSTAFTKLNVGWVGVISSNYCYLSQT